MSHFVGDREEWSEKAGHLEIAHLSVSKKPQLSMLLSDGNNRRIMVEQEFGKQY